ncbi:hypothetical protein [Clostridium sardiniense]|uniref:hypothetical protein n=1 Tax=Clostridium sardiniense TaxID=29369 RepID=UPI003D33E991
MKSILKVMINIGVCLLIFGGGVFVKEVFEKSNTSVSVRNSILVLIYIIGAALFVIRDFLKVQNKNYIINKKILYEYREDRFKNIIIIFAVINITIITELLMLFNIDYMKIIDSTNLLIPLYTFLFISILVFTFYFITSYNYKNKIFEEGIELYTSEFKKFNEITKIVYESTMYGTRCKYKIFFKKRKITININESDSNYIKEILEMGSNIKVE